MGPYIVLPTLFVGPSILVDLQDMWGLTIYGTYIVVGPVIVVAPIFNGPHNIGLTNCGSYTIVGHSLLGRHNLIQAPYSVGHI